VTEPVEGLIDVAEWNDSRVQMVYHILCDTENPAPDGEHWEGWLARRILARRIIAALESATPAPKLTAEASVPASEASGAHGAADPDEGLIERLRKISWFERISDGEDQVILRRIGRWEWQQLRGDLLEAATALSASLAREKELEALVRWLCDSVYLAAEQGRTKLDKRS
jgi:hypothetical protein